MKKIIIANWKMNGNKSFTTNFVKKINDITTQHNVVLCLPYPYLYIGSNKTFDLGAQDCHQEENGAYTGDVSPTMLLDIGCKYVILGHSERRSQHHEINKMVKEKALSAIANQLIPIVCIGEKNHDDNFDCVLQQCEESLCDGCIIAYEPIWTIGSGVSLSIDKINQYASLLKQRCNLPIIYGGSVNQNNAAQIMTISSISGLLIGKSSLNSDLFLQIINDLI